jgi:hypothetical protein
MVAAHRCGIIGSRRRRFARGDCDRVLSRKIVQRSSKTTTPLDTIAIRLASEADDATITRLRRLSQPENAHPVDTTDTTFGLWWVAEEGDTIRACAQVFGQVPLSHPRVITVSNAAMDGTNAGKQCLSKLLEGVMPAEGALSLQLPYCQRSLIPWLERRLKLEPYTVLMCRSTTKGGS